MYICPPVTQKPANELAAAHYLPHPSSWACWKTGTFYCLELLLPCVTSQYNTNFNVLHAGVSEDAETSPQFVTPAN